MLATEGKAKYKRYKATGLFTTQPREWSLDDHLLWKEYLIHFYGERKFKIDRKAMPLGYYTQRVFADSGKLALKSLRRTWNIARFYTIDRALVEKL